MEINENATNIDFYQIKYKEYSCNINRNPKNNFFVLSSFDNLMPHFDEKNGPHMIFNRYDENDSDPNNNTTTIVNLCGDTFAMRYDNANTDDAVTYFKTVTKLKSKIAENLIRQTYAKSFENPSIIQKLAVPELVMGKDAIIQFKAGTGKTHTFLLGALWHFDPNNKNLQHVFITNSHEVATQTYNQVVDLLDGIPHKSVLCIGQKNNINSDKSVRGFKPQQQNIRKRNPMQEIKEIREAQIIVATMGKFYDYLCNKHCIFLDNVKTICVDEFDNIVSLHQSRNRSNTMNTQEQFSEIIDHANKDSQRIFISATVSSESIEIAYSYFRQNNLSQPFIILLNEEDLTLEDIKQYYAICSSEDEKKEILLELIRRCRITQAIIFTNTIATAKIVKEILTNISFGDSNRISIPTEIFHGELSSDDRKRIYKDFVDSKIRILVSTDITARGLDISGINVVINYNMPTTFSTYVHRIGRSGRYGKKGVSISFILVDGHDWDERDKINEINSKSKKSKMTELDENFDAF